MSEETILNAVPHDGAEAELESLKAEGIEVSSHGALAEGVEPRVNLRERFEPVRGVMGVLVRALAQREREKLVGRCEEPGAWETVRRDAARIHSCEGGAGI